MDLEPMKWTPTGPPLISLIDMSPFPGSLIHLGASRGLWSQTEAILGQIFTFTKNLKCNPITQVLKKDCFFLQSYVFQYFTFGLFGRFEMFPFIHIPASYFASYFVKYNSYFPKF